MIARAPTYATVAWRSFALVVLVASMAATRLARAQDTPAPAPPTAPAATDETEARRKQAQERFYRGLALYKDRAWDAALAEFMESRRLHPTRAATRNAALSLRKLGRYDEALVLFESLAREFGEMPAEERETIEKEVAETRALVARIEIRTSSTGAVVMLDGIERGVAPLGGPIVVPAGAHLVTLYKDGYLPGGTRVDAAGGKTTTVELHLRPLGMSGRLRVLEQRGQIAEVVVDGTVVGRTPWEGALAVGAHGVALRGPGVLGSQPGSAAVRLGELTTMTMALEPLESAIAVTPTPIGASVVIDGVAVGRGIWEGRVRAGRHRVEVAMDGYLPVDRSIAVAAGGRQYVAIELERDRTSSLWASKNQPRFVFSAQVGPAFAPTIGGEVASNGCDGSCDAGTAYGALAVAHAGYQLGSGIGFGLELGYLRAWQSVEGRSGSLKERPDALRQDPGRITDDLSIGGMLVGGFGSLQLGSTWLWTVRIGAGFLVGSASDARSGRFVSVAGAYDVGRIEESHGARYAFASPEVRVGYRVIRSLEVSAGLSGIFLLGLDEPRWSNETDIVTTEFFGFYDEETITSRAAVVVSPTIGVRLDL